MDDELLHEISYEGLGEISGGYIYNSNYESAWFGDWPWEVLDKKGNVVARMATREYAKKAAKEFGYSTKELSWDQVQRLRETGSPD